MRTTIDLPDELYREAKTRAVQEGMTLKSLMIQFVRSGLRSPVNSAGGSPARRSRPPVAIQKISGYPPKPALTNRQLHALLEEQEVQAALASDTSSQ